MRHNGDVPTVVVRSLPARAGTVIVAVSAVIVVGAVTLSDGPAYGLRAAAWSALVTGAVWLLWWVPELVLDADGLTVRNAWRSHVIRWGGRRLAPNPVGAGGRHRRGEDRQGFSGPAPGRCENLPA